MMRAVSCFIGLLTFSLSYLNTATAQFSADDSCQGINLYEKPCLVSQNCNYAIKPKDQSASLLPYPVCLPKGRCDSQDRRNENGKLYTKQRMLLSISNTSAIANKRVVVRSTLEIGGIGASKSRQFPKCITNHFVSRDPNEPLKFAYGTCKLDSAATKNEERLCDLFDSGLINTRDVTNITNVVYCEDGLIQFRQGSACALQSSCELQLEFEVEYAEDGPVAYYPFRGKEMTIQVEIFQMPAAAGDTSYVNDENNPTCRQFPGYPRALGFFYVKFYTMP